MNSSYDLSLMQIFIDIQLLLRIFLIQKTWVCDGIPDCSRGEDESKCGIICEDSQFRCGNISSNDSTSTSSRSSITCIGKKHVCDGKNDCPKGEGKAQIYQSSVTEIYFITKFSH
jgi:hypothetical protein